MEYFDFDEASHARHRVEDFASNCPEADETDANECFEALFFDKNFSLPIDPPAAAIQNPEFNSSLPKDTGHREEDFASDCPEVDEVEAVEDYDALFFDKNFSLPTDAPGADSREPEGSSLLENGVYPMYRAKDPCSLCRGMGLDCFIAQRGVMQNGCTCCISLYRECSFTHAKAPGVYLDTLHSVTEDVDIPTGGLTGRKTLKSLPGGPGSSFDDLDGKSRKSGARFSREAVRILKTWLSKHTHHPYPNDREKDELKSLTGLKRSQICNWLANARRRGKIRPAPRASSPVFGAIDIPQKPQQGDLDVREMSPLERWKHSPPEHEAASATAIARAMAAAPYNPGKNSSQSSLVQSRKTSSNDSTNFSMFKAPSISSLETGRSSTTDLSFASAFSHRSHGSFGSMDRKDRRRRRRTPSAPYATTLKSRGARIFQCTFCTDSFPAKYDWQRHEKSLHLALEKWTCAPNGGTINVGANNLCVFCRAVNPSNDHLETHNFTACQEKSIQERTFYRKDHLRQHLRLMHDAKFDASMEAWKSTTSEIKSSCGFCPKVFSTWQQRVDHLAAHFKTGVDMSQWEGGWGFERHVELLVENSMPPYLIAQERSTMNPWKAQNTSISSPNAIGSSEGFTSTGTSDQLFQDSNCWRRLERALTEYVAQQLELGIVPTDQMLQDHGRLVIFGSDDPWNQTSADNAQWLDSFKFQAAIGTSPEGEPIRLEELPMDPPYVFCGDARSHVRIESGSGGGGGGVWTGVSTEQIPATSEPAIDSLMDMNFEGLDLQNMDLEGFDEGGGGGGGGGGDLGGLQMNGFEFSGAGQTAGMSAFDVTGQNQMSGMNGFGFSTQNPNHSSNMSGFQ